MPLERSHVAAQPATDRCPRARFLVTAIAALIVSASEQGCSSDDGGRDERQRDASFGLPAQPFQDAGALSDGGSETLDGGAFDGSRVELRVFQGVVNLPGTYICHDPDYAIDRPETVANELDAGPLPALELPLTDGGAIALGVISAYTELSPLRSGAITVHRSPPEDAGSDAGLPRDAGPPDDGGGDGAATDGGDDAATGDGGTAVAARCGLESIEAVLPLPTDPAWLSPARSLDGGLADASTSDASVQDRGILTAALGGDRVTLFGSGLALDPVEVARRQQAQYDLVLAQTGRTDAADAAARRTRLLLDSAYGARFLLSRAGPALDGRFALFFSHLIPDVPAVPVGRPAPDSGSGALHVCMTVGMENTDAPNGAQGFEFRNFTPVANDMMPGAAYRFRLFVQADFPSGPSACATTSLKPVAELQVESTRFVAGGSYTLVAWGAISSDAICTGATPLVRAGCAAASELLLPRLEIIDN